MKLRAMCLVPALWLCGCAVEAVDAEPDETVGTATDELAWTHMSPAMQRAIIAGRAAGLEMAASDLRDIAAVPAPSTLTWLERWNYGAQSSMQASSADELGQLAFAIRVQLVFASDAQLPALDDATDMQALDLQDAVIAESETFKAASKAAKSRHEATMEVLEDMKI